ncbi:MAG: hypothetical protein QOJ39_985 [Candidatus Eremiobacteraeota bacterium]|jgi:hypothetical protein|nr:hypothetical protein [Candidatus Eremiobacteraeota bacterium]
MSRPDLRTLLAAAGLYIWRRARFAGAGIILYARQLWSATKKVPVIGLVFSSSLRKHAIASSLSLLAVIAGALGVWLPALVYVLHASAPFGPQLILTRVNVTTATNGELLILVPSLLAPCGLLLFGPWKEAARLWHQVGIIAVTALVYLAAVVVATTQLSGGVKDTNALVLASWVGLALAVIMLYLYELLDRLSPNVFSSNDAEEKNLLNQLLDRRERRGE